MSVQQDSAEMIISQVETARSGALSQDEKDQIHLWQKGQALKQITAVFGWECVLEMLQSYVVSANKILVGISPDKKDEVAAQHAVTYALSEFYNNFVQDVQNAISAEIPDCVVDFVRSQSPASNNE